MRTRRDPLEALPVIKARNSEVYLLMTRIIMRGGLYATAAAYYLGDDEKSRQFVTECFEQTHHCSAQELWGEALVMDIVSFRTGWLRSEMRRVLRTLHGPSESHRPR